MDSCSSLSIVTFMDSCSSLNSLSVCSMLVFVCSYIIDISDISDRLLLFMFRVLYMFNLNFNSSSIYSNSEISRSHAIRNFDLYCNNFSKIDNTLCKSNAVETCSKEEG
jgi:hypothetical protein